jgi:hypothetical protein
MRLDWARSERHEKSRKERKHEVANILDGLIKSSARNKQKLRILKRKFK